MRFSLGSGLRGGRRRSCEVGQALVEFALVITALLLIALGVFEFGRAVEAYSEISNGAREGARYASVHPDDLEGARAAALAKLVLAGGAETEASISGDGKLVTVTVRYGFQPVVPFVWSIFGSEVITLTNSSTMRVEGVPK